jgi:polyphenol oxidase
MLTWTDGITPQWPAIAGVKSFVTTRKGGISLPPYTSLNLGDHVQDNPAHVAANRVLLANLLAQSGATPIRWRSQVHGIDVANMDELNPPRDADALITTRVGEVCAVLTADCLPVLFAAQDGSQVAAAHAGWRGLVNGVLENTLQAFHCPTAQIQVWLGPAISQAAFEVGDEVRTQFVAKHAASAVCFQAGQGDKWFADIYGLARIRLQAAGVAAANIYGGGFCTVADAARFYSYRRQPQTGRMASCIWRVNPLWP